MSLRKFCLHAGISLFLFLNLNALSYTIFRWSLLPPSAFWSFYGMMAPFQGYSPNNAELIAEGLSAVGWERIDLQPYFPVSTGERSFRGYFQTSRLHSQEKLQEHYALLANRIQEREREQGRHYEEVRLVFEVWPASPDGFDAKRMTPFVERHDPLTLQ